jgi:hypothetical protein
MALAFEASLETWAFLLKLASSVKASAFGISSACFACIACTDIDRKTSTMAASCIVAEVDLLQVVKRIETSPFEVANASSFKAFAAYGASFGIED